MKNEDRAILGKYIPSPGHGLNFDEEKRSVDQKVDETDPTSIFEQSREHLSPGFEM